MNLDLIFIIYLDKEFGMEKEHSLSLYENIILKLIISDGVLQNCVQWKDLEKMVLKCEAPEEI
jgi:hypothetical protein